MVRLVSRIRSRRHFHGRYLAVGASFIGIGLARASQFLKAYVRSESAMLSGLAFAMLKR
jgi:hypothetical protein